MTEEAGESISQFLNFPIPNLLPFSHLITRFGKFHCTH